MVHHTANRKHPGINLGVLKRLEIELLGALYSQETVAWVFVNFKASW
jgi:hypothetical protein